MRSLTAGAIVWNSSAPGKMKRACPVLAPALLLLVASTSPTAAQPQVTKVEPRAGGPATWNPVRVLVRGSARAPASRWLARLTVGLADNAAVRICSSICTSIRPPCRAPNSSHCDTVGTTEALFDIAFLLRPLPGFSTDDVIYLAMPDRFRDGDAANNDPAVSRGLFDRGKPITTMAATSPASSRSFRISKSWASRRSG